MDAEVCQKQIRCFPSFIWELSQCGGLVQIHIASLTMSATSSRSRGEPHTNKNKLRAITVSACLFVDGWKYSITHIQFNPPINMYEYCTTMILTAVICWLLKSWLHYQGNQACRKNPFIFEGEFIFFFGLVLIHSDTGSSTVFFV